MESRQLSIFHLLLRSERSFWPRIANNKLFISYIFISLLNLNYPHWQIGLKVMKSYIACREGAPKGTWFCGNLYFSIICILLLIQFHDLSIWLDWLASILVIEHLLSCRLHFEASYWEARLCLGLIWNLAAVSSGWCLLWNLGAVSSVRCLIWNLGAFSASPSPPDLPAQGSHGRYSFFGIEWIFFWIESKEKSSFEYFFWIESKKKFSFE